MKKITLAVLLVTMLAACTGKKESYTVKGTIAGVESGQVVITNYSRTFSIADTTAIKNGKFTFKGNVTTPETYYLSINGEEPAMPFFLDNGDITLTIDLSSSKNMVISGSKINDDINALKAKEEALLNALPHNPNELVQEYNNPGTSDERKNEIKKIYDEISSEIEVVEKEINNTYITYIKENPSSPYAASIVRRYMEDFSIDELTALLAAMTQQNNLQNNRFVNELDETVKVLKQTAIGQMAPDFTQNDPNGNPVTFSDIFKNHKLTMIDFWASWCGPCRRFNPTLVKLYDKYHKNGFEIMAVSLDREKDKWIKGIEDDKLTWVHVSDLQYWDSEVAKLYNIRFIPQNVFVDEHGTIIAKRVSEEEMDGFIAGQLAK